MNKKFIRVCLSLDSKTVQLLGQLSDIQGVGKSEFVRMLITGEKQIIYDKPDFKIVDLSTKKFRLKDPFSLKKE